MPNADRAAVAREEVLRFLDEAHREGTPELFRLTGAQYSYLSGRAQATYPAPPAPVTVTVTNTWTQQPFGYFTDHIGNATPFSDEWATALHRIAADARRMIEMQAERETARAAMHKATRALDAHTARIAELEQEREEREEHTIAWCGDGALEAPTDGYFYTADAVRQFIQYVGATKGEGRGEVGVSTAAHGGSSVTRPDQGESPVAAPSPAPIPLGAVASNDDVVAVMEDAYGTNGCDINAAAMALAREVVALRHPVAGRETVKQVAKAIDEASRSYSLRAMARAALTAAGFTLEAGA